MKPRIHKAFVPIIAITMVQYASAASGTWIGATNGTWNTTDTNWSGVTGTPWDTTNGPTNTATFNLASLAAVMGGGTVNTNGITFTTGGNLSGGTINLVGASPTISVAGGQTALLFNSALNGSGGLIKTGTGILTLGSGGGGVTVSLTGANSIIDVQSGVLRHNFGNSNWTNNRVGLNVAAGAVFDVWQVAVSVDELTGAGSINKGWTDSVAFTIGNNNGSGSFSGVIHNSSNLGYNGTIGGTLSLIKQGSGTQILSGVNLYNGSTTINGGTLQLSGAGALSSSTAVSVAIGATFDVGGRNQTISGLSGAGEVTNASGTLTVNKVSGLDILSGNLTGGTGLTKTGAGALSLAGVNTYSGATNVTGGVLGVRKNVNTTITVAAAGGLGLAVGTGPTYFTTGEIDSLWAGSLSGVTIDSASSVGIDTTAGDFTYTTPNSNTTRGFAKLGSNTLTLTGTNSYTGGTTVFGGVLSFANAAARPTTGTITVGAGAGVSLGSVGAGAYTSSDIDALWANTVANVSMSTNSLVGIDTTAGNLSYATPVTNLARGLAKVGANTLTLTGANAYTGGTYVGAGKLVLVDTKTGSSNFVTNGDLEFDLSAGNLRINGGTISGTGNLIKSGTSTLDLGNNGSPQTIALTGDSSIIQVQGGTLKNDWGNNAWKNNRAGLSVASGATFSIHDGSAIVDELTGAGIITNGFAVGGPLTIGVANGTGIFTGTLTQSTGPLALIKNGTGTQTLSGSNINYSGGTTVNDGKLTLVDTKSGSSNFIINNDNAVLEFNVTTAGDAGRQQLSGGTISGTGKLIKTGAGSLLLGAQNTPQTIALTGADTVIDVQGGVLRNEYFHSTGWNGNKAGLTVASGATFDIWDGSAIVDELIGGGNISKSQTVGGPLTIGINDGTGIFTGVISNSAGNLALVKQGNGTQTFTGTTNTYSGGTTVNAGILLVSNASGSGTGTGAVTVKSGATLGGGSGSTGGRITGATVIESGGFQTAGTRATPISSAVIGIQTFAGGIDYQAGSIFEWNLAAAGVSEGTRGTDFDGVSATSFSNTGADALFRVVLNGTEDFTSTFWTSNKTWSNVFTDIAGTTPQSLESLFGVTVQTYNSAGLLSNVSAQGSFTISGSSLSWTAVPEPSSALAGLLITAGLLRRRRAGGTC